MTAQRGERLVPAHVVVDDCLGDQQRRALEDLLAEVPLAAPPPRTSGYRGRRTLPKHARTPDPRGTT